MNIRTTTISGLFELLPKMLRDERGHFVKTFHQDIFTEHGFTTRFAEEYYSFSHKNVLRGLHFQKPPLDHVKMVYCVSGAVIDAVLDLRTGSNTFGSYELFDLSAEKANVLYIPSGLAHGFYVTSDHAIMMYKVTTVYAPEHDAGIHWNSAGIPWPSSTPIVSKRDAEFVQFTDFTSPFLYRSGSDHGPL